MYPYLAHIIITAIKTQLNKIGVHVAHQLH